jgi:hypothetical protein
VSEAREREERRRVVEELERRAENAKRLLDEMERQRQEAERQGLNFAALSAEELKKKLERTESPIITWASWTSGISPGGGAISYTATINNPDPVQWSRLYMHVFVGLANLAPGVGEAISAVDTRFPRLTLPRYPGLTLAPGATQNVHFAPIWIPAEIEATNYLGNAILFQANYTDVGKVLDRGQWVFLVSEA